MKRGRPKGATAYPETAVCIKCGVFRPKRRGYCDRCRPRNRGASSKTANSLTLSATSPAVATVSSPPPPAAAHNVISKPATGSPGSQGSKRRATEHTIREKRRRTTSAPTTATGNTKMASLHAQSPPDERNLNVDVVSVLAAAASGQGKDRKLDSEVLFPLIRPSSSSFSGGVPTQHQLALLLPRSDGTAVDVVPIRFLPPATPTATASSPALSSLPTLASSPSVPSHPLMSLANASVLAASRSPPLSLATASPSHSWSSPASSPPHAPLPAATSSPFSSPTSAFASLANLAISPPPTSTPPPVLPVEPRPAEAAVTTKAGDLILPSLCSLQLPRPALPSFMYGGRMTPNWSPFGSSIGSTRGQH